MEKIQMTEEQAKDLLNKCYHIEAWQDGSSLADRSKKVMLTKMKNLGYVKKSVLELARDLYCNEVAGKYINNYSKEDVAILRDYKNELEKEVERLKRGIK